MPLGDLPSFRGAKWSIMDQRATEVGGCGVDALIAGRNSPATPPDPPRGNVQVKIDDKGRLKLPAPFVAYVQALGSQLVHVTSIDKRTVRVYPISVWRRFENELNSRDFNQEIAQRIWRIARHYGGDAVIDDQGRILIPGELRQDLKLKDAQVYLCPEKSGRFDLVTKQDYDASLGDALAHAPEDGKYAESMQLP